MMPPNCDGHLFPLAPSEKEQSCQRGNVEFKVGDGDKSKAGCKLCLARCLEEAEKQALYLT